MIDFLRRKSDFWKYFLFYGQFLIVLIILFSLSRIAVPIGLSFIFYLITAPLVPQLKKLGLSELISNILIVSTLLFFIIFPIVKSVPVIKNESTRLEQYLPKAEYYLKKYYFKAKDEIKARVNYSVNDQVVFDALESSKVNLKNLLLSLPNYLGSLFEWILLVPLFLFFFLKDGHQFKKLLLSTVPNPLFERFYFLTNQFNKKIGDYILAKFIEASILGVIITTGLLIVDVRFAFVLGLVAAITNIIPYVGPLFGSIPGIIVSLVEFGPTTDFYAVVIIYMAANLIDLAIVFPILVSKIVDLHPVIVVLSVILGSQYLGVVGMIISIPVAAAFKLILQEVYREMHPKG